MKRFATFALAAVMILMTLTGCGSTPKESDKSGVDKPTYGVICQAMNSEYWLGFAQGAKEGAEEVGVEVLVNGPKEETEIVGQISMIEDYITKGVDALLVAANQAEAIIPTLEAAQKKGIPVMEVDVEVGWDGRVCYVGAGNYNGGVEAGKWYNANLPAGSNIAIIRGAMGDPTHDLRANGCLDTLEGMNVVSIQPADSLRDKAVSVMENILTSNPDVKGVFCTNDEMAMGALKAVEAAGKDIKVIGFDGTMEALYSIESGGLAASVSCVGYDIAKLAVVTMHTYLNGNPDKIESSSQIFVPPTCVDASQVETFIKEGEALAEKIS